MLFRAFEPSPQLAGFVDNIWIYEGYEAEHSNERILPSGTIELVINLRENELRIYDAERPHHCDRFSGAVVSGAYRKGFLSDSDEERFIMGVHFRPGGAFPFLGIPADKLADTHIDLDTLWNLSANRLRERLCEASTPEERFNLLEEGLTDHLFRPMEHHHAVAMALEAYRRDPNHAVRGLAKEAGLSERRFIEIFRSEVGMTPKLYSRVQRFQRTRSSIHQFSEDTVDWPSVAVDCGYFDQSHLIRDFSEFSGTSPAAYLGQYNSFIDQSVHIKSYHMPLNSKAGQFYPIQPVTGEDIISLGGTYVPK